MAKRAETESAGLGAIDGYHEDPPQSANKAAIRVRADAKHAVEHRDGRQVARPHPDEGIPGTFFGLGTVGIAPRSAPLVCA